MVHFEYGETDGGRIGATVSIADGVGERVGSDVAAVWGVEQRAAAVVSDRSVGRLRKAVDAQRISVDVAIIGQRGYDDRRVLIGACRVIVCRGSIIDRIDDDGHRGCVRTTIAVTDLVNEAVAAVEVCTRRIGK